jgi:thiol:disulfide interchange protein
MRQQLRLRVLVPVAVLGLLGAGFGAFAMGGPAAPESMPVTHPTSSAAVDTGATDTGAVDTAPTTTTVPPAPAPTTTEPAPPSAAPKPKPKPEKTALEQELAEHRVVVVVFHTPGSDVDGEALFEARAGAAAANAGFLAVDVTKENTVAGIAAEYEVLSSPTVLVVVKSGEARSRFDGYVDRLTVAQAVTNALK